MKLSALLMSVGTVAMLLLAPAAISDADAAGIKINPTVSVKVAPRVKVAKPKPRQAFKKPPIKLHPKLRVATPKPQIRNITSAVVPTKPRVTSSKINTTKIAPKPKLEPQIAAPTHQRNRTIPVNTLLTETARLRTTGLATPKSSVSPETKAAMLKAAVRSKPSVAPNQTHSLQTTGQIAGGQRLPGTHSASAPDKPELNVPGGFKDVFSVSGGNLNDPFRHPDDLDALVGAKAMKDLIGGAFGSNELPAGSGALGRQRVGAGFDGPLMGAAGGPTRTNKDRDGGWTWTSTQKGDGFTTRNYVRVNSDGGVSTLEITNTADGSTYTVLDRSGPDGTTSTTATATGPADDGHVETGTRPVRSTSYVTFKDGKQSEPKVEETETGFVSVPTDFDQNGDGIPDDIANPTGPQGGDQGLNYIPPSKNAGNWTPFGGHKEQSHTWLDTISQPDTDEQGTVMVRGSARPNAGTGAVTNGGDGSFVASGNRGGGGTFGMDPCATVKGPGCGGPGPEIGGPEGTPPSGG